MARKFYSVKDAVTGKVGYASIPELGFVVREEHVCKLLNFLGMLPDGDYIVTEIDAETYYLNVEEKELEKYAYA